MKPDGYIVCPPLGTPGLGPLAICAVTYLCDKPAFCSKEQAIDNWLKDAQEYMRQLRQQIDKVLDLKASL